MDETALIRAATAGELQAFNQLVLRYQDLAFRHAFQILKQKETAEDMTQDAFILAFRNLASFRGGSFRAWLLRIVSNTCYDELRRWKRRPTVSLYPLDGEEEEVESPRWLADPSPSPEDHAERADLRRILQRSLDELKPDYRQVLELVDVNGLDYSEAAQVLGVPVGTIKSRLARARVHLRNRLEKRWIYFPGACSLAREIVG